MAINFTVYLVLGYSSKMWKYFYKIIDLLLIRSFNTGPSPYVFVPFAQDDTS
jgi:hypothetical protein